MAGLPPEMGPSEKPLERRLDSWKEIAAYLDRDVSTVQRWEKQEGMPVHRHLHDKRGSVYALTSELEIWLRNRTPSVDKDEKRGEAGALAMLGDNQAHRTPRGHRWLALAALAVMGLLVVAYIGYRDRTEYAARPTIKSLAVLPLRNLSGDATQEYLADGMTEELIGRLAKIHALRVISRTTAMHFKDTQLSVPEIAKTLGVDAVVEGSVIREGGQVRVHAQLIRGATDEHIWAGEYEREYGNLLALQEAVAQNIVEQIEISLTPQERLTLASTHPVAPEAHEEYLKGLYCFYQRTRGALEKSNEFFQQAIARDPNYALAYSGLADTYTMLGFRGHVPSKDALTRAKAAALKAIELDDTLAERHVSLAFIAETHEWDWATEQREY